jgi:hypothetical protein
LNIHRFLILIKKNNKKIRENIYDCYTIIVIIYLYIYTSSNTCEDGYFISLENINLYAYD